MKSHVRSTATALVAAALLGAAPFAAAQATTMEKIDAEVSEALTAVAVKAKLITKLGGDGLAVKVEIHGNKAVLTGEVEKKESQELAKEVALSVAEVEEVDNRVTQKPSERASAAADIEAEIKDGVLETRVKGALLSEVGKNALKIEVEATNGVVSLRGTVPTPEISKASVAKAKSVPGVTKVVDLLRASA
ncbi:MAG TPA: BON domain-containing protein [Thermoanaerobaculia bacterium]|nr:BON domain-containing protein [Thermoanaerobaculia bacterium]